jgi:uncharacterized protein YjbI with pentapeptide repeats
MANEESLEELLHSIQQVIEAKTNDFVKLARIAGLDIARDFAGADLSNADLRNANLSYANLSHVNLSHANLSYANLSHANLSHANLSHANLIGAKLTGVNIEGANLTDAVRNGRIIKKGVRGPFITWAIATVSRPETLKADK